MSYSKWMLYLFAAVVAGAEAQIVQFPYLQNFDSVTVPNLPIGWGTTTNRSPSGDFKTTSATVRSTPNAVVDSNATISQALISPVFNFSGKLVDSLEFYERRTPAHNSGLLVEASLNGGSTYTVRISDTLNNLGATGYIRRSFALPTSLNNQPNIKFRWNILGNGTGTSATTIRFDDVRITTKIQFDVGISALRFVPVFPLIGDSVAAIATVKNFGIAAVASFPVKFYDDVNFDSIPQPSELLTEILVAISINPGDSATTSLLLEDMPVGEKQIIVVSALPNDENPANDKRVARIATGVPEFSVVINEIMYGPQGGEPEWVELTNISAEPINLKQWKIADRDIAVRAVITATDYLISPSSYVVIAKDSAELRSLRPDIPARIFHVPALSILNNDSDIVVIFDHRGARMDSVYYRSSWGGTSGRSLERILATGPSNLRSNWGNSLNPAQSTPGRKNSLTPKDYDVSVARITFQPVAPLIGDSVWINSTFRNKGRFLAVNVLAEFYEDRNRDSIAQFDELLHRGTIAQIPAGDSASVSALRSTLGPDEVFFIVRAVLGGDEDTTNNISYASVIAGYPTGSIVINEIMYGPTSPEPEWVELINRSNDTISLKNWRISDRATTTRALISGSDYRLAPNQFAVVAKDSGVLMIVHPDIPARVFHVPALATLNNDSDLVVLFDPRLVVMDSVNYRSSWGGTNGRSLERVLSTGPSNLQTNWGNSVHPAKSTPGRKNSITQKDYDLALTGVSFTPSTPIAGDSVTVRATIANRGRLPAGQFTVEFFEDANSDSLPQPGELFSRQTFLYLESGDSVRASAARSAMVLGNHLMIARIDFAGDEDTLNNIRRSGLFVGFQQRTVVINEIMYAPQGGEPEWVEFFNPTSDTVNLRNWRISNRNSASRYVVTATDVVLFPRRYLVATKDSALLLAARFVDPQSVIQSSAMPTFLFNNLGDGVVLFDSRGALMDSTFYSTTWGGTNGRSLERIDALLSSTDSTNWGNSGDSAGATAGRPNFLTPLPFDLRAVRAEVLTSGTNQSITVRLVVMNVGLQPAGPFAIALFHDANGDSVAQDAELILRQPNTTIVSARDSTSTTIVWTNAGYGRKTLILRVEYDPDMRSSNNSLIILARVSYPLRSLVINEIMYEPFVGDAEYVEIYNRSSITVDLRDWKVHDRRDAAGKANEFWLSRVPYNLQPGEFFVLSSDSSILRRFGIAQDSAAGFHLAMFNRSSLSLNNEGDDVVLRDLTGAIIDSIRFEPSWHNSLISETRGRALERIHPDLLSNDRRAWSTCALPLGGTPCKQNSIFTSVTPSNAALAFSPNPFSPDSDGREDFTLVSYQIPATVGLVRIRIFDVKGRLIRTLANGEPSGPQGSLVWDGMDDDRQKVRMGIYVVLLEGLDANGGTIHTAKGAVVVAVKL